MGRSKFPGKPTKLVNKKRISVLSGNSTNSDNLVNNVDDEYEINDLTSHSSNNDRNSLWNNNLNSGLSTEAVSQSTFNNDGDDNIQRIIKIPSSEQPPPPGEDLVENNSCDTENVDEKISKMKSTSFGVQTRARSNPSSANTTNTANNKNSIVKEEKKLKKKTVTFKNVLETSDDITEKKVYNPDGAPAAPIIKKESLLRSSRFTKSECLVRPSRLTEILKNNENNIDKLNSITFRSSSSLSGISLSGLSSYTSVPSSDVVVMGDKKFILPKRSLHSCRVIKPNKRFLDGMDGTYNKKHLKRINKQNIDENQCESDQEHDDDYNKDSEDEAVDDEESEISKSISEHEEESDENSTDKKLFSTAPSVSPTSSSSPSSSTTLSKVILREPKLQFPPSSTSLPSNDGPFSFKSNSTNRLNILSPSLSACQICNTISSQFGLDQNTRKFGAMTCEACRRFISKMIKKLAAGSSNTANTIENSNSKMECNKKDGTCIITPMIRSNSSKPLRKTFKERCHACWLKKCLKTFQIPSGLRSRLTSTLPANMKTTENNSLSNLAKTSISPFSIKKEITDNSTNIFSNPPAGSRLLSWPQDCVEMDFKTSKILSITNPLIENNATFGSSPLIKPNVLEKPVFMISTSISDTTKTDNIKESKESTKSNGTVNVASNKHACSEENDKSTKSVSVQNDEQNIASRTKSRKKEIAANVQQISTVSTILTTTSTTVTFAEQQSKRQRIDLKGPRVKHVCRSASIVLGQPIATFGNENTEEVEGSSITDSTDNAVVPQIDELTINKPESQELLSEDKENLKTLEFESSSSLMATENSSDSNEVSIKENNNRSDISTEKVQESSKENIHKIEENQKPLTRKFARPGLLSTSQNISNLLNTNLNTLNRNKNTPSVFQAPPQISIDFWENYDPTEVSRTGFGLIVTESVPLRALCFLCGSSGLDKMIFCVCCCEPYHQYCVEDEYNLRQSSLDDSSFMDVSFNNSSGQISQLQMKLNWLCPRCTVCYTCNMSSGTKLKCQKCQKNYHSTCLGTSKRLLGADRPLICANCLKCKSCGTTNVTKFVGNLPMCQACFKLRQRGNFCPLCQKCYEENDFDLKMMECGDCKRWVHAKCEGVPDEQYNMLSVLPEHIEFICKKCSNNPNADIWREAVINEFKTGMLSVIKLLSKSRQACALLKLSPRKKSSNCQCQPIIGNRSIQFSDHNEASNVTPESENVTTCYCDKNESFSSQNVPSLLEIKRKINSGEYYSVQDFNYDMQLVMNAINCDDLSTTYKEILSETFPWFQNETKACTDALVEDMYDSSSFMEENQSHIEMDQEVPMIDVPEDIEDYFYSSYEREDSRTCMFCKGIGEGISSNESRLLYCGHNVWVHTNCALWSAEVFEEIDGSLQNVHSAISRGRMIKCSHCSNKGATVGCNVKLCGEHYHYPCARNAGCVFLNDKTVYCPQHLLESDKKNATAEKTFEVLRPVYVELDRRKKKMTEPSKIQFLIGSLYVKNIGKFVPYLSDTNEAIVPSEFKCTRLYWSSKEPWKIVEYSIKTSVQNNSFCQNLDMGRNFTVDHSSNSNIVQLGLNQIQKWHSTLLSGEEFDFSLQNQIKTSNEEANEEEPQNNADLLPPEIKDAIFEDLPHDLLDGISMLDILPKLMTYEDLVAMDMKNEAFFGGDLLKEGKEDLSDVDMDKNCEDSSEWNNSANYDESSIRSSISSGRELKRSKSEVFPRGVAGNRSQQRSCSLNWSCKLDSNSAVKRRKVSMFQELKFPENVLLSLGRNNEMKYPNSVGERRLSLQNEEVRPSRSVTWTATKKLIASNEIEGEHLSQKEVLDRIKISQLDGVDDLNNSDINLPAYDNNAHNLYNIQIQQIEAPVKCDKCHCTYRTQESFKRHLAACEPMSTSDSESETALESDISTHGMIVSSSQDINFTNNSIQSFMAAQASGATQTNGFQFIPQNVLQGSIPITNLQSSSIQGGIPLRTTTNLQNQIPISAAATLQNSINTNMGNVILSATGQSTNNPQPTSQQLFTQSIPQLNNFSPQLFPIQSATGLNQFNNQPQVLQAASALGVPQAIAMPNSLNLSNFNNQQIIQQQPQNQFIQIATSSGPQIVAISSQQLNKTTNNTNQIITNSPSKTQLILPQPSDKLTTKKGKNKVTTAKSKVKAVNAAKPIQMKQQRSIKPEQKQPIQIMNTNVPMIRPNNPTAPNMVFQPATQPILVQQMGSNSNNLVQYVTDGHNTMQYIAMPSATNDFKQPQPQYLATPATTIVPGALQLQTDSGGNLVLANTPTGLSVLPIAQPQQPQVIGTLIQPQATTIQCGMMATEQMMLGSTPTLEMVTDPSSGCMYLTSQPVYYGLETIVRNTVMSSQQFVSTAMQGVLSQNSSFSATTTQVFQASKIEPIMEVPTGYVVLNNDVNLNMLPQANTSQNIMPSNVIQQPAIPQLAAAPQIQTPSWRFIKEENPVSNAAHIIQTPQQIKSVHQPLQQQSQQVVNKVLPSNGKQNQTIILPEQKSIILPKISEQSNINQSKIQQKQTVSSSNMVPIQIKPNNLITKSASVKPKIIAKPVSLNKTNLNSNNNSNINARSNQNVKTSINNSTSQVNLVPTSKQSHSIFVPLSQQQQQQKNIQNQQVDDKITTKMLENYSELQLLNRNKKDLEISIEKIHNVTNSMSIKSQSQSSEVHLLSPKEVNLDVKTVPQITPTIMLPQQSTNQYQSQCNNLNVSSTSQNTTNNLSQSSSIQLPTTPYAPVFHSNGIPTNVVNPLQQHHHNSNTNITINSNNISNIVNINNSRPTNRVLPMQTLQQKLSPPTPPEPKLHIETDTEKYQMNEIKDHDELSDLSSPNLIIVEKDPHLDDEQGENEEIDDEEDEENNFSDEAKFENYLREKKNNDEVFSSNHNTCNVLNSNFNITSTTTNDTNSSEITTTITSSPESDDCIPIITDECTIDNKSENIENVDNAMNNIRSINSTTMLLIEDDKDDSNDRDENIEVKEQISQILVNLENEEYNNNNDECKASVSSSPCSNDIFKSNESIDLENNNATEKKDINEDIRLEKERIPEQMISTDSKSTSTFQKPSGPYMLYEIQSEDGFTYKSTSISEIWDKVFEAVQLARKAHGLTALPDGPLSEMSGYQMLGLKTNALKYLLEQLPGVEKCVKYIPKYHKKDKDIQSNGTNLDYEEDLDDLTENQYGTARCEPYSSRSGFDMFSWLASRHRKQPALIVVQNDSEITIPRRGSGSLPMAMRYRTLKEKSNKDFVGVFRSHIHGRGLFCTRDIEAGEMVIEYAGERIRSVLTDKREKYYDSKGIGCYMFKMDENTVVDATMRGSAARFINHSCDPNCYSKVVDISGEKHIIIFALRRIVEGEELTYDYKFPIEDEKIPCSCGAKRCRKYLN